MAINNLLLVDDEKVVDSDVTIALHGERGTGKKLLAQTIHFSSTRREKPFLTVNCAAMPENFLQCGLFGHETNPIPRAYSSQAGKLELATGKYTNIAFQFRD